MATQISSNQQQQAPGIDNAMMSQQQQQQPPTSRDEGAASMAGQQQQTGQQRQQPNQPPQNQSGPQHTGPPALPSASQLCRMGQETVQEIVNKTMELFTILRQCQPPNGTPLSLQVAEERKAKLQEHLNSLSLLFRKLRKIYEKVNEMTGDMEFVQIESLIPLKDSSESSHQRSRSENTEVVRRLNEERNKWAKTLEVRNRQLKDIIDILRDIVWDINTMLAMRKP